MSPKLKLIKSLITSHDLILGNCYEINCCYRDNYGTHFQIVDEEGDVNQFVTGKWFDEHFEIIGDIEEVMEEI